MNISVIKLLIMKKTFVTFSLSQFVAKKSIDKNSIYYISKELMTVRQLNYSGVF